MLTVRIFLHRKILLPKVIVHSYLLKLERCSILYRFKHNFYSYLFLNLCWLCTYISGRVSCFCGYAVNDLRVCSCMLSNLITAQCLGTDFIWQDEILDRGWIFRRIDGTIKAAEREQCVQVSSSIHPKSLICDIQRSEGHLSHGKSALAQ